MQRIDSQKQAILNRLMSGGSITAMEALRDFGCYRLASRISDLRKDGVDIKKTMEEGLSAITGKTVRYARYSINNSKSPKLLEDKY